MLSNIESANNVSINMASLLKIELDFNEVQNKLLANDRYLVWEHYHPPMGSWLEQRLISQEFTRDN